MTEVRRPFSLQLGSREHKDLIPVLSKTAATTPAAPTRPRTITATASIDGNKRCALEPKRRQLTASTSSSSLVSLSSSSTASFSSSSNSSSSPFTPPQAAQSTTTPATNSVESSEPDSPSLILPYLYVGDQAQTKIDTISNLNISYILSLQSLPKFLDSDIELAESCASSSQSAATTPSTGFQKTSLHREQLSSETSGQSVKLNEQNPFIRRVTSAGELERMSIDYDQQPQAGPSRQAESTSNSIVLDAREEEVSSETMAKELLPCVNSSKDYLVKFRSCVNRLIKGKCINISDTFEQYVERFFDETHNFIEEARRNKCNILVHCKAGISRSPTIAIAYLMKWKRLHLQDAYDFVKRCRPQISPNLNFMGQLMNYERRLLQRGLHEPPPLPSPITSCLLSHPYHESVSTLSSHNQHQHEPAASSTGPNQLTPRTNETTNNEDLTSHSLGQSVEPTSSTSSTSSSSTEQSSHVPGFH